MLTYDDFMDMYSYMYETNTYDQVYAYIINESLYNLACHKNILYIFKFMYVTNINIKLYICYTYMYNIKTWRAIVMHICVLLINISTF